MNTSLITPDVTAASLAASGTDATTVVTRSAFSQFGLSKPLVRPAYTTKARTKDDGTVVPAKAMPAKTLGEVVTFHRETYDALKKRLKDEEVSAKDRKVILGSFLRGEEAEAANMAASALLQKAFAIGGAAQQAVVKNGKLHLEVQLPESNAGRASAEELRLRQENAALKAQVAGLSAKLDAIIAKLGA